MKFDNRSFLIRNTAFEQSNEIIKLPELEEKLREKLGTGNDLQDAADPEKIKACKDLAFFLRKPFCCK